MSIAAMDVPARSSVGEFVYPSEPERAFDHADSQLRLELARELHDQVAQNLTTMLVRLENFKAEQTGRAGVQSEIVTLQNAARDSLHGIRQILHELRGRPARDADLVGRLRTDVVPAFIVRSGIPTRVRVARDWPPGLPAPVVRQLLRVVQEALTNVHLHSGATRAEVRLAAHPDGELQVVVHDNGRGFVEAGSGLGSGYGLLGIRERVVLLGGHLTIRTRTGRGCNLVVRLPRNRYQ